MSWTLCRGIQSTCWSPTDPSSLILLPCQHINLPYGSYSAMVRWHMQASSCCMGKTHGLQSGFPPAHHTTLCTLPQHPEPFQAPCCYMRVSGCRLGKGDAQENAETGPRCSQGMGLTDKKLNLFHGPICSSCSQPCTARTESVGQHCKQLASSTNGFGKAKINPINILAFYFSTNTARISLLQYFVNN